MSTNPSGHVFPGCSPILRARRSTDSIDPATWTLAQERVQQSLEECIELASGLSLLAVVLLRLLALLQVDDLAGSPSKV
jgi:hypothetical protein